MAYYIVFPIQTPCDKTQVAVIIAIAHAHVNVMIRFLLYPTAINSGNYHCHVYVDSYGHY
jgi:hypothetical protein